MSAPTFKISNCMKNWREVTASEIRLLIAFCQNQEVLWKPTYSHYFISNELFATPSAKQHRFVTINRCHHFVNNEVLGDDYAMSAKGINYCIHHRNVFQLMNRCFYGKSDVCGSNRY